MASLAASRRPGTAGWGGRGERDGKVHERNRRIMVLPEYDCAGAVVRQSYCIHDRGAPGRRVHRADLLRRPYLGVDGAASPARGPAPRPRWWQGPRRRAATPVGLRVQAEPFLNRGPLLASNRSPGRLPRGGRRAASAVSPRAAPGQPSRRSSAGSGAHRDRTCCDPVAGSRRPHLRTRRPDLRTLL